MIGADRTDLADLVGTVRRTEALQLIARRGIVNMGERAHGLGGAFEIGPGPGGTGTMLTWRAPIAG